MTDYLTTAQVAERLEVSPQRVRQWIDKGRLKAERFGSVLLISAKDLAKFKRQPTGRPKTKAA